MFRIERPWYCISLGSGQGLEPIRSVLVAREADAGGAIEPVVLEVMTGVRIYLAALVDQNARVLEWLELWVQCSQELESSPMARCGAIGNASLDLWWARNVEAMRALDDDSFIETDWDRVPPVPTVIDPKRMIVARLVHRASNGPLELCRDETTLQAAGLKSYGATLERWFRTRPAAGDPSWLSVRELTGGETGDLKGALETGADAALVEFNSGAGFMMLRKHHPIRLEGFLRWLSRDAFDQAAESTAANAATPPFEFASIETAVLRTKSLPPTYGQFASQDVALEAALVRLQLWSEIVRVVHTASSRLQAPLLNLTTDSFRVSFSPTSPAVPLAWSFRVLLARPGTSTPIRIGDKLVGFSPLHDTPTSAIAAPQFGGWQEGNGTLHLRQIGEVANGHSRIEGGLDADGLGGAAAGNCIWVQFAVDGRTLSFLASIEPESGGGVPTNVPFVAAAVDLSVDTVARLKTTLPSRHPCQYVLLRPVSPVFDVYALGVIGVRIFLADRPEAVADLVDDVFALAALLPSDAAVDDFRRLNDLSNADRPRRLLAIPRWAQAEACRSALSEEVWLAILRELTEFVAAEAPQDFTAGPEDPLAWLNCLAVRCASLEQLTLQVRDLLVLPRSSHDEIARVVNSFV